jgi:hypothetical protein
LGDLSRRVRNCLSAFAMAKREKRIINLFIVSS